MRGVAALVMPIALGSMSPLPAFAGDDALKKIEDIPLTVLQTIAGGSVKEFTEMKETFKPAKELQGTELALYKLYRYAAVKTPATEDPRLSLRPLFFSKSGDALFQLVAESAKPKVYDARGDGLTNQGKGGVIKGTRVMLETLKSKGVIGDFSVDSSAHNELSWAQANPSSVTVTVKAPLGAAANKALEEERVGLALSLVAQALSGYYKQCKIQTTPDITTTADGESIKLNIAWAGKARQKNTMDRRNADKLNAARGYKE